MLDLHTRVFVLVLAVYISSGDGSYVITTPRALRMNEDLQVCLEITSPEAPAGEIALSITRTRTQYRLPSGLVSPYVPHDQHYEEEKNTTVILPPASLQIPPGKIHLCRNIPVPGESRNSDDYFYHNDDLLITGHLDGKRVNHSASISRSRSENQTVIQTDKYLYKPGQMVQFRILTHGGPLLKVSTEPYPEVYVKSPSDIRIAQWLDVDNSRGLVHLSMRLADEPEEGEYSIFVARNGVENHTPGRFKVEEYVLPRFEVTVEAPKKIPATAGSLGFKACASYTFGQPVKGNISWEISNEQNRGCNLVLTKNDTISGCSELRVMSTDIRMIDCNVYTVKATATVTEEGTGIQEKGTETTSISRNAITFEELRKDNYKKPNLPATLKVKAKLSDDSPAVGELLEVCHGETCSNITTPEDGIITLYLTNQDSRNFKMQQLVTRAVMYPTSYSANIQPFFSPSNSSLLIYAPEESLQCVAGKNLNYALPVLFATTSQTSVTVNVQVMSRGKIQYAKSQDYSLTASKLPFEEELLLEPLVPTSKDVVTGVFNVPLDLPPTASPNVKVLVWYVRDDGEVVSDVKQLNVEKCLPNTVSLNWSTNKTQPGDQATLSLASEPNAICSLGIVDKSVDLLIPESNKLTIDSFMGHNFNFDLSPWTNVQVNDDLYCRRKLETNIADRNNVYYYSDFVDTLKMFDESGLYIFSDLSVESRPCEKQESRYRPVSFSSFSAGAAAVSGDIGTRIGSGFSVKAKGNAGNPEGGDAVRTDFPETWLWDLVVLPSTGLIEQPLSLPDTITEWVGKAVCIHPEKGIGLSEEASITTFSPFFVDLTLPPSMKRGEVLSVKISVFNYLQQPLPVSVTLESSPEYEILGGTTVEQGQNPRTFCLSAQDKQVHTVKIRPVVLGQVNITVSAFVDPQSSPSCGADSAAITRRDALVRPITVEAEGFPREKSWSKYICAGEVASGQDILDMTEVSGPAGMVEGSERAWVTAVGDLLAISLQNLESLVHMPYGSGDLNMLNFAPNVYIMQYLRATRQGAPDLTQKLMSYINTGYQRQLLYRRPDGSFSDYGKADESGSTWLTAFVLKTLSTARQFTAIDKHAISEARRWLTENYGNNTCVTSVGNVYYRLIKGGVSGNNFEIPLTAYVLISLLESEPSLLDETIHRSLKCLSSEAMQDPYALALKAYALSLAGDLNTPGVISQLFGQAVVTKNSTHWDIPSVLGGGNAVEVEIAGYAVLAMMKWNATFYEQAARKVVKWISSQMNGRGGFYSTQDTVIALQALSSFESQLYQGDLDLVVRVQAQDLQHSFSVKEANKLVQQMVSLPTLPTNVSFSMQGQGCAVLQTVMKYNDPEPDSSDALSLKVNTRTEPDRYCITKRISACASYLLPDSVSNMAVLEVNLVSGYIPEKEDLKQTVKNTKAIKQYEVDGNKVSFHIDQLSSQEVCVNFRILREVEVENVKPGSVVVYDQHQPEFVISKIYNLPAASECLRE